MGKTTWMLQVARNIARQGRPVVYFCYEHDQTTMLIRLVALEAGLIGGVDAPRINRIRSSFEAADGLGRNLTAAAVRHRRRRRGARRRPGVLRPAAHPPLVGHHRPRWSRSQSTIAAVAGAARHLAVRLRGLPAEGPDARRAPRTSGPPRVTEQLKDMTLDHEVPVLAIVASDKEGIEAGKRMRVSHMRGSSALAYEADTVLMLNNKYDVVARHHLVYDTGNVERYKDWAVLSIEKNRSGLTGVDMEFPKRFEQSRFDTRGQPRPREARRRARLQPDALPRAGFPRDVGSLSLTMAHIPWGVLVSHGMFTGARSGRPLAGLRSTSSRYAAAAATPTAMSTKISR